MHDPILAHSFHDPLVKQVLRYSSFASALKLSLDLVVKLLAEKDELGGDRATFGRGRCLFLLLKAVLEEVCVLLEALAARAVHSLRGHLAPWITEKELVPKQPRQIGNSTLGSLIRLLAGEAHRHRPLSGGVYWVISLVIVCIDNLFHMLDLVSALLCCHAVLNWLICDGANVELSPEQVA